MGNIEIKSRKRKSRKDIQKAILTSVKMAGLLSIALVAPNAVQCLKSFGLLSGRRKGLRDKIRNTLLSMGFLKLQNSAWIYPYDCEDLINLLKADFKVGKDLLYLIVDSIENDKSFRKSFALPLEK